jgi:N-acetyllactosaminide alpha-2,3-sialyltransferase
MPGSRGCRSVYPVSGKLSGAKNALLLVRTPFQAWLAQRVLRAENVAEYEVVYFTHNNSPEDRHYFSRLAAGASKAGYFWAPVRRFDILGHMDFYRQSVAWKRAGPFDVVLLASINSLVINAMACRQDKAELVTFDDGLANIKANGMFQHDVVTWRTGLYRRLLGGIDLTDFKQRISRHYSIYTGFANIVEKERLRWLDGWPQIADTVHGNDPMVTYFIGQPFEEVLTTEQIGLLQARLKAMNVDFYVLHPRERYPLDINAQVLEKRGRIAEDAILQHAQGSPVHLVGWFSTTLFNLARTVKRCTMLLLKSSADTSTMEAMALKAGCSVVLI